MNNNQLANTAIEKINTVLKKHESDRTKMVAMTKKIYNSYNALKEAFSKLTIEHTQTKKDLERAQSEIKRLEKSNGELSSDVMMLASTVSLLDQSIVQSDDILIDSIRSVVRDFNLNDAPTTTLDATIDLVPASAVPALAVAAAASAAGHGAPSVFVLPELVSAEEAAAAEQDLLSDQDIVALEAVLSENLDFSIKH